MSEQRSVTVTEIQTPDLYVPVCRAGGDQSAVLVKASRVKGPATEAGTDQTGVNFSNVLALKAL